MLVYGLKRWFTTVHGSHRVDFHTQKGDKAAAAGADGDADRLRDAVNVIFGVQGARSTELRSTPCMLTLGLLRWAWGPCAPAVAALHMVSLVLCSYLQRRMQQPAYAM